MELLTDIQLDEKIEQLNHWLNHRPKWHPHYKRKQHARNYWVRQRIALAEN